MEKRSEMPTSALMGTIIIRHRLEYFFLAGVSLVRLWELYGVQTLDTFRATDLTT